MLQPGTRDAAVVGVQYMVLRFSPFTHRLAPAGAAPARRGAAARDAGSAPQRYSVTDLQ